MDLIDVERARELGCKVARIVGVEGFERLDRLEPEYLALKELHGYGADCRLLGLLSILAAVNDYRIDARWYWNRLLRVAEGGWIQRIGSLDPITLARGLAEAHIDACHPARGGAWISKRRRLERIFDQGFPEWFVMNHESVISSREGVLEAWMRLSLSLESDPSSKTLVFSVKALDMASLVTRGRHLEVPDFMPIPVDAHVRDVALSSGIVRSADRGAIIRAWQLVMEAVRENMGDERGVSVFSLDSLVWQIGSEMSGARRRGRSPLDEVSDYLRVRVGISGEGARDLALEFARFSDRVT